MKHSQLSEGSLCLMNVLITKKGLTLKNQKEKEKKRKEKTHTLLKPTQRSTLYTTN